MDDLNYDSFQETVRNFYRENGRDLPWRNTDDAYKIFVSEIMLQQTQSSRVIPKYTDWINQWPTFSGVAQASRSSVLKKWQGLGYNRRAKFLHQSAQQVVNEYSGSLPEDGAKLRDLPGVGSYTAGALQAFCFHKPVVFVETNIRTVFIHHFFSNEDDISDKQIKQKLSETLPDTDIREWYWGLMDYGKYIKKEVGNLNNRSQSYQAQSTFAGSNRQLRSKLLRFVLENEPVSFTDIDETIQSATDRQKSVKENLDDLVSENMITKNDREQYQTKND